MSASTPSNPLIIPKSRAQLATLIDHTNLSPGATKDEIRRLCAEAEQYNFHAVCLNPVRTYEASRRLKGSNVKVVTVVSFPFGSSKTATKLEETKLAIDDGSSEIDLVANLGRLCENDYAFVVKEISQVARLTSRRDIVLKVIIETGLFNRELIILASKIVQRTGADFVKTCTGYGPRGVTVRDVRLIHEALGEGTGIKAAGGIGDAREALQLIRAGATRIGTSRSLDIINSLHANDEGG